MALEAALEGPDTAPACQQERHHARADDGGGRRQVDRCDEEQAPPQAAVAEVVGVAGVAPEAGAQHLALVGGVGLEAHELRVADRLEHEADDAEAHADPAERLQPLR